MIATRDDFWNAPESTEMALPEAMDTENVQSHQKNLDATMWRINDSRACPVSDDQSDSDRILLSLVREAAAKVRRLEAEHERKKADAASAKKQLEAAQDELTALAERKSEELPLFDGLKSDPEPEAWRAIPVGELDLSETNVIALNQADLCTIGNLADYLNSGKKLTDVPKVGEKKAEAIQEALDNFWQSPAYRATIEPSIKADDDLDDENERLSEEDDADFERDEIE